MSMSEFSNQLRIREEQVIIFFYNYLEKRRLMKNPNEITKFSSACINEQEQQTEIVMRIKKILIYICICKKILCEL